MTVGPGGATRAAGVAPGGLVQIDLGPAASERVRRRDAELGREGWSRRFVGGPPRLAEMVDLYRELGHDVHTEPLADGDLEHECAGCTLALSLFRIVYTRSVT